jgi:hypothetical protein
MSVTSNPEDPRLTHGVDAAPRAQSEVYLVLSEAERAKGFTRPLRLSYRHTGLAGPQHPLRDLTAEEQECYAGNGYVRYEEYPADALPALGRFWTQAQLDAIGNGCGSVTTMNRAIAETYSASPGFYGATFCVGCRMHLPVGASGEFTWLDEHGNDTHIRVGT